MNQSHTLTNQQLGALFRIVDTGIVDMGSALQEAAGRGPAKVLAFKTRMSDEGVRKVRDGERRRHSLPSIMSWLANDPHARDVMRHYLDQFDAPELWDHATQRDFYRDLNRAGR